MSEDVKMEQQEQDKPTDQIMNGLNDVHLDEFDALYNQLQARPQDVGNWKRLVQLAEESDVDTKIRAAYDALLKQYPNTSAAQVSYIDWFMKHGRFNEAEDLFKRYLRGSPMVDLWRFYLQYVLRPKADGSMPLRDVIRKSYEFALSHIGQDKDSGEIWKDYIHFIESGPGSKPEDPSWDKQQRMDSLRKVYHRALQVPMENLESIWSSYEAFEKSLNNPNVAKKFIADLNPAYMQARATLRKLKELTQGLFPHSTSREDMTLPMPPTFSNADLSLIGRWRAYLKWEMDNPLEIEEKDRTTLIARIQAVYRKAVIRMRYYPEIWFMAYNWTNANAKPDDAIALLKAGVEANPSSFLLNFAYAEALELKRQYTEVHDLYTKFLDTLRAELDELEAKVKAETETENPTANGNSNGASMQIDGPASANTSIDSTTAPNNKTAALLALRRKEYGIAYVMYIRFARRAEGEKAGRTLFGKARKDRWTPWEVYEAAAYTEFHSGQVPAKTDEADKQPYLIASRIFDKGFELFGEDPEFVDRHLVFLLNINDINNARSLFERAVNAIPAKKARILWERWGRYEYTYGTLEDALAFERRYSELFPTDNPTKRFAQRYTLNSYDVIAQRDLGFAIWNPSASGSGRSMAALKAQPTMRDIPAAPQGAKRGASPDGRERHREERGTKRMRNNPSPDRMRERERERDRWEGPPRRRSPPRDAPRDRPARWAEREDDKNVLPVQLKDFIGRLPPPHAFDGPIFRTDDLVNLFRTADIPTSLPPRARSPPRGESCFVLRRIDRVHQAVLPFPSASRA
ncbi:hypothetical protein EV121DRAFT_261552 [Schizophyllum commune]